MLQWDTATVRGDAVVVRGDAPAPRYNTMNVVRCDASNNYAGA